MLQFKISDTDVDIIVTLNEKVTLTEPHFLFVFTHLTTKDTVAFVKSSSDDLSEYPDRFNKFNIDAADLFGGDQPGEWHYRVYQQESSTNLTVANAGSLIETGKLILERETEFEFTKYEEASSFKTYNG
jgi:hypothetical protein